MLDVIEDEGLIARSGEIGETIRGRMLDWQERYAAIGDVRGLGAMLAIELVHDRDTKEPAPELASAVVEEAAVRGLLLLKSGIYGNCIRVLVPARRSPTPSSKRRSTCGRKHLPWRSAAVTST